MILTVAIGQQGPSLKKMLAACATLVLASTAHASVTHYHTILGPWAAPATGAGQVPLGRFSPR